MADEGTIDPFGGTAPAPAAPAAATSNNESSSSDSNSDAPVASKDVYNNKAEAMRVSGHANQNRKPIEELIEGMPEVRMTEEEKSTARNALDTSGDGKVSMREGYLAMDGDGDGKLSRAERVAAMDFDGDGKINPREREAAIKTMLATNAEINGEELNPTAYKDFRENKSDLKAALRSGDQNQMDAALTKLDRDGDGQISSAEREQMFFVKNGRQEKFEAAVEDYNKRHAEEKGLDASASSQYAQADKKAEGRDDSKGPFADKQADTSQDHPEKKSHGPALITPQQAVAERHGRQDEAIALAGDAGLDTQRDAALQQAFGGKDGKINTAAEVKQLVQANERNGGAIDQTVVQDIALNGANEQKSAEAKRMVNMAFGGADGKVNNEGEYASLASAMERNPGMNDKIKAAVAGMNPDMKAYMAKSTQEADRGQDKQSAGGPSQQRAAAVGRTA